MAAPDPLRNLSCGISDAFLWDMSVEPEAPSVPSDSVSIDLFIYGVEPIDAWLGWMDEHQFRASLDRWYAPEDRDLIWTIYENFRNAAQKAARDAGWEGDVREGPFIAGVPTFEIRNTSLFMVAWKQDEDGLTFIGSPVRLPWLEPNDAVGSLER